MIEFSTMFGKSGNNTVDRLSITNVIVSKQKHTVDVEFANELSATIEKLAREQIKKTLGDTSVTLRIDPKYLRSNRNVMFYTLPQDRVKTLGQPEIIGRARAEEMLIGRPIRDENIIAISSINEGSGRVTVSGRIFRTLSVLARMGSRKVKISP